MTVLEYGNDMVVIDAGIMFPDDDHPGWTSSFPISPTS